MRRTRDASKEGLIHNLTELRRRIDELQGVEEEMERTQEELGQAKAMFEGLFEFAPDAILVVDPQQCIERVNRQAELLFGYGREELLGKPHDILVPERFRIGHREQMERYMAEPRIRPMGAGLALQARRKDGSEFPVDISLGPLRTGKDTLVLSMIRDFTARMRLEEALLESEERYRQLVELSPDGIIILSQGKIAFANTTAGRILGATDPQQLVGQTGLENVHPDYRGLVMRRIRQAMEEGKAAPLMEEKYVRLDGSVVDVEVATAPFKYQGKPAFQTVIRDITDRKRAQEALLESEERYRKLVELSPDSIIIHSEGKVLFANSAAAGLFGAAGPGQLVGQAVADLVPPDYLETARARIRQMTEEGKPVPLIEGRLRRLDGSVVDMEVAAAPFTFQGNIAIQAVIRDVSGRKLAEEKLKQTMAELARSNAELEQFANVASHDLHEPLRVVTGFAQLLERRYKGKLDKEAHKFLSFIVDGSIRMQKLIDDLLEYARVTSRARPFEPADCESAFATAAANLGLAIGESGATVTHGPLPTVRADPSQLVQLFQNLVGNGVKFRSAEPPRVHVSTEKEGGEWVFSVRDNGMGIPRESFEEIFVLFQRLHARTEYPGTGVGLAICKRIVERHGGRIWVESQPGGGSTFYFTIPE